MKGFHNFIRIGLVTVALSTHCYGQVPAAFGVKGGLTISTVHSPELVLDEAVIDFGSERRFGLAVVAFIDWFDNGRFGVTTELGYVQRGFTVEHELRDAQNLPAGSFRTGDRFDYATSMVLMKLSLRKHQRSPYALAGPRLDVLLGAHPNEPGTVGRSLSSTTFGGTLGVGVPVFSHEGLTVIIEARLNADITNSLPDVPRDLFHRAMDFLVAIRL